MCPAVNAALNGTLSTTTRASSIGTVHAWITLNDNALKSVFGTLPIDNVNDVPVSLDTVSIKESDEIELIDNAFGELFVYEALPFQFIKSQYLINLVKLLNPCYLLTIQMTKATWDLWRTPQ